MIDGLGDGGFEQREDLHATGSVVVAGNIVAEDIGLTGSMHVETGDFIDTADEGALRVEGAAVVSYNTGTTQYSLEQGAGSITSGSTTAVAFTTAFQLAPAVSHSLVWDGVAQPAVGSMHGGIGSITSAGFDIVNAGSGAGYVYSALGQKA